MMKIDLLTPSYRRHPGCMAELAPVRQIDRSETTRSKVRRRESDSHPRQAQHTISSILGILGSQEGPRE